MSSIRQSMNPAVVFVIFSFRNIQGVPPWVSHSWESWGAGVNLWRTAFLWAIKTRTGTMWESRLPTPLILNRFDKFRAPLAEQNNEC